MHASNPDSMKQSVVQSLHGGRLVARSKAQQVKQQIKVPAIAEELDTILGQITDQCAKDRRNLSINGKDVEQLIIHLIQVAYRRCRQQLKTDDRALQQAPLHYLLYRFSDYYQFGAYKRQYCSSERTKALFDSLKQLELEGHQRDHLQKRIQRGHQAQKDWTARVRRWSQNLRVNSSEDDESTQLLALLLEHLAQVESASEPQGKDNQDAQYHQVGKYIRSQIRTWADLLTKGHEYSAYPFCTVRRLDRENVAIVIVTRDDPNFFDPKVAELDQLPPVQLLLCNQQQLSRISLEDLKVLEGSLRLATGRLNYAGSSDLYRRALAHTTDLRGRITDDWITNGIPELLDRKTDNGITAGLEAAAALVERLFCKQLPGIKDLEALPFDRAYIFMGSAANAVNPADPHTMPVWVQEAAVRSSKPEDSRRHISVMERDPKAQAGSYDLADKRINALSKYAIPSDSLQLQAQDYHSSSQAFGFKALNVDDEDTLAAVIQQADGGAELQAINACLAASFARFALKQGEDEPVDAWNRRLSDLCLPLYRHYDEDGICLLQDFSVAFGDDAQTGEYLRYLQQSYFASQDCQTSSLGEIWEKRYKEQAERHPKLATYAHAHRRYFVTLVSFDPRQSKANQNYPVMADDGGFTILFVADREVIQGNLEREKALGELRQVFSQWARQRYRDGYAQKKELADRSKVLNSLVGGVLHRVKHDLPPHKQVEVEAMRKNVANLFEDDKLLDDIDLLGTSAIGERLLQPFLSDKLGADFLAVSDHAMLAERLNQACDKYLKGRSLYTPVQIDLLASHLPACRLRLPEVVLDEAIRVLFNNALEHATLHARQQGRYCLNSEGLQSVLQQVDAVMLGPLGDMAGDAEAPRALIEALQLRLQEQLSPHLQQSYRGEYDFWQRVAGNTPSRLIQAMEKSIKAAAFLPPEQPVRVSVQLSLARASEQGEGRGPRYRLELTLTNPGQVPAERLAVLNAAEPAQVDQDKNKASSTGVGLYLVRVQLQKQIGDGADISLYNLDNDQVLTRLSLPASLISDSRLIKAEVTGDSETAELAVGAESMAIDDASSTAKLTNSYILYVEDDDRLRAGSLMQLQALSRDSVVAVHEVSNRKDALASLKQAWPGLVLMDLTILSTRADDSPSQEHGIKVLKRLLKAETDLPPIVLLTGASDDEIHEAIQRAGLESSGYQYRGSPEQSERFEPGALYACGLKDLSRVDSAALNSPISTWLKQASLEYAQSLVTARSAEETGLVVEISHTEDLGAEKTAAVESAAGHPFVACDFFDPEFDQQLETYRLHNISDNSIPASAFVASSAVDNSGQLFEVMHRWMAHPGLLSFYPDEQDEDELTRLARNESYRALYLRIVIPASVAQRVPLKLYYWCLPHNILLTTVSEANEAEVARWIATPFGARGALSKIRHDLQNVVAATQKEALLQRIAQVEQLIAFETRLWNEFGQFVRKNSEQAAEMLGTNQRVDFDEMQLASQALARFISGPLDVPADKASKALHVLQSLPGFLGQPLRTLSAVSTDNGEAHV